MVNAAILCLCMCMCVSFLKYLALWTPLYFLKDPLPLDAMIANFLYFFSPILLLLSLLSGGALLHLISLCLSLFSTSSL